MLMVERVLEEEYVMQLIDMQKLIINMWKIKKKKKESSYLNFCNVNNLCGWAMSQKF